MSIVVIQPGSITLPDPTGGGGGAVKGIPGPFINPGSFSGVSAITGSIRSRCGDAFGDSPPIANELYLVTGFRLAYAVYLPSTAASTATTITTQLELLVGPDVVYEATDSQDGIDIEGQGVNAIYIANGTFTADLVNPIAVTPSDRLQIQLGTQSIGLGVTLMTAVSLSPYGGADTSSPVPSTMTYELLNRNGQ